MFRRMIVRSFVVLTLVFMLALVGCSSQTAPGEDNTTTETTYPEKPIKVIIHTSPGGGTDIMARTLFKHVEKKMGTTFVIENHKGAGGQVGYTTLAMSKPDGYTIGAITTMSIVTHELTREDVPYKLKESFLPIARVIYDPSCVFVRKDSQFQTLEDLLAYAKEHPGEVTWGGTMVWGAHDVHLKMLQEEAGVEITYVPFDGAAETRAAILGGHVDVAAGGISEYVELVQQGELRCLAVGDDKRRQELPDVPTYVELGYDVIIGSNRGFAAPAGTPEEYVNAISQAIKETMEDPEFLADAEKVGIKSTLSYMDSDTFTKHLYKLQDVMVELLNKYK